MKSARLSVRPKAGTGSLCRAWLFIFMLVLISPGIEADPRPIPSSTIIPRRPVPLPALPDLVIRSFDATDRLGYDSATKMHTLPVAIVVANAGTAPASAFSIVAKGASSARQSSMSLVVDRQATAVGYGMVGALNPGESRRLTGRIFIPQDFQGQRVSLTIMADSPQGEEFAAAYGRVRESNEGNNTSRPIVTEIPVSVPKLPIVVAGQGVATNRISQPEKWIIGFKNVKIKRQSESSGDEPYFICYGFRAQLGVHGSATAFRQGGRPSQFITDSPQNVVWPVHSASVTFDNVRRFTWEEYNAGGHSAEFLGVIVVAMEHDDSDFGDVVRVADRAVAPLQREIEKLIGRAEIALAPDRSAAIDSATGRVRRSVEPNKFNFTCWKLLEENYNPAALAQVFDPDDFIGVQVAVFVAMDDNWEADDSRVQALQTFGVPRLRNTNWTVDFTGTKDDHCDWEVGAFAVKSARPSSR